RSLKRVHLDGEFTYRWPRYGLLTHYNFEIECNINNNFKNTYDFILIHDDERRVWGLEADSVSISGFGVRLLFNGDNFSDRRLPFGFEYFANRLVTVKDMRSLLTVGSTPEAAANVMAQSRVHLLVRRSRADGALIWKFWKPIHPLAAAMGNPDVYMVVFKFDERERLEEII